MTRSKTLSLWTETGDTFRACLSRPVMIIAVVLLILSLIYVNQLYSYPSLALSEHSTVDITGQTGDYIWDSEGNVKSFVVKNVYIENRPGMRDGLSVLCYVNSSNLPPVGSTVKVNGKVSFFNAASNPGEFDSAKYYRKKHIVYCISNPDISIVSLPKCDMKNRLFQLRQRFSKQIKEGCPLEYGTINTILWADKSCLPPERKDLYRSLGLAHFLVISGLHIQALGTSLYMLLRHINIRRSLSALSAIVLIILYAMLIGFQISIIRAVIMFSVRLFADIFKRPYDMLTSMGLSIIITLFIDPFYCADPAFIYSYISVFALALYMEIISPSKKRPPLALIIWLFLLPITLRLSFRVTALSIILNLLLGIFTTPLIAISFLCFIFSLHNITFMSRMFDFFFALLIRLTDTLCKLFDRIDFMTLSGAPPITRVCLYLVVLTVFILFCQKKASFFTECLFYLSLVLFISIDFSLKPALTMLDVGQGECLVLEYSYGKCLIFDCGSTSKKEPAEKIILPFLEYRGIKEISGIFLSHNDADHTNALPDLMSKCSEEGIKVKNLIISEPAAANSHEIADIIETAAKEKVPLATIAQGNSIKYPSSFSGHINIKCLWPDSLCKPTISDINSNYESLVLWITYDSFDILFMGDATSDTEKELAFSLQEAMSDTEDDNLELLIVGHHGSKNSSSTNFLSDLRPDYSLISVGLHNSYNHPHPEVLKRLKDIDSLVLRTDYNGAVTIVIN